MNWKLIPSIINLTNYAIGATLMTIPYIFSECGIILSLLLVLVVSIVTVLASELLLQAGVHLRRTSYESLCMSCFGTVGKAVLEFNMIGMMYGALIAYVIILGELGGEIFHEYIGLKNNSFLRPLVLIVFSGTLITPLCLRKNIDKLASASALSLLFYVVLAVHICLSDPGPIELTQLHWWRPRGVMGVIPIIALGFTIQTQIFPVFNSIPDSNVTDMKMVIRICTALVSLCYCAVGMFGYWRFASFKPRISADLLAMYPTNSISSSLMKIGFLASVAVSYPLTVFPVRTSLYSLFFVRNGPTNSDLSIDIDSIPDKQFSRITFAIIISSFVLGFLMDNIEIVLSLTGSFSGSIILFILPALVFIKSRSLSKKRGIANFLLLFGLAILGLSFLNSWNGTSNSSTVQNSGINQSNFVKVLLK